jgi:hypothetical protein
MWNEAVVPCLRYLYGATEKIARNFRIQSCLPKFEPDIFHKQAEGLPLFYRAQRVLVEEQSNAQKHRYQDC